MTPSSRLAKNNGQYKCRGICNWSCVHDAIDSEANRENDDQWQQEEHLSCKGHDHTKPGFPMEVKKPADIGWIPLAKVISMKMRRYFLQNESTGRCRSEDATTDVGRTGSR